MFILNDVYFPFRSSYFGKWYKHKTQSLFLKLGYEYSILADQLGKSDGTKVWIQESYSNLVDRMWFG